MSDTNAFFNRVAPVLDQLALSWNAKKAHENLADYRKAFLPHLPKGWVLLNFSLSPCDIVVVTATKQKLRLKITASRIFGEVISTFDKMSETRNVVIKGEATALVFVQTSDTTYAVYPKDLKTTQVGLYITKEDGAWTARTMTVQRGKWIPARMPFLAGAADPAKAYVVASTEVWA